MHHIYHTDAFVLGSRPVAEDSKSISLYTRELGLVHARAQGIRKISSKLRYVLQDYARASVDLVRGREVWRLISASPDQVGNYTLADNPDARYVIARTASVVLRLIAGEEPNEELFDVLASIYTLVANRTSPEEYAAIELIAVGRVLGTLGYLGEDVFGLLSNEALIEKLQTGPLRQTVLRAINDALAASQL